ncbi:MAG: hypothetical protein KKF48_05650 [Nanoarchaeota archaeon]|nr:hypothetical protein [Nanoarchaeota archaeon]
MKLKLVDYLLIGFVVLVGYGLVVNNMPTTPVILPVEPIVSKLPDYWGSESVAFSVGSTGSWDVRLDGAITPIGMIQKDGKYFLYYIGADGTRGEPHNDGGPRHRALGVATSIDGKNFVKYSGNPIITFLPHNNEEEGVFSGAVTQTLDGTVVIYYSGMDAGTQTSISVNSDARLATSSDGYNFVDKGAVLEWDDSSLWGYGDEIHPVAAFQSGSNWYLYYVAKSGGASWDVGLAYGSSMDYLPNSQKVLAYSGRIGACRIIKMPDNYALLTCYESGAVHGGADIEARYFDLTNPTQLTEVVKTYDLNLYDIGFAVYYDGNRWLVYYLSVDGENIMVREGN